MAGWSWSSTCWRTTLWSSSASRGTGAHVKWEGGVDEDEGGEEVIMVMISVIVICCLDTLETETAGVGAADL